MKKVISKDGTTIAFDKRGKGPALILVGGARTASDGLGDGAIGSTPGRTLHGVAL